PSMAGEGTSVCSRDTQSAPARRAGVFRVSGSAAAGVRELALTLRLGLAVLLVEALERLGHEALGLGRAGPLVDLDPLAGLEVLVVLEEVRDLLACVLLEVVDVLDVLPAGVLREHGHDLVV